MNKTYLDIAIANESIVPVDIKGKSYSEVNQRIKAFRMVYPQGYIDTEIVSNENGIIVMSADVGFYKEIYLDDGKNFFRKVSLGTGHAYEKEDSSFINKTSYIENCETSAVGRALGMAGFGIDVSVASAEEMQNAIQNQEVTQEEADEYELTFGKYKGKKLKEVYKEDRDYIQWMVTNTKDERMLDLIRLATGMNIPTKEELQKRMQLTTDIQTLENETDTYHDEMLDYFKVKTIESLNIEQLEECKKILEKKKDKKEKENE